ncbi:LytR/AlgR family response regulator transcription factor [Litoribrevibacter euphylliae]|uniref:LytR/AlgR family response regulator transcription factor n=1 Tax=Litoribrevibacter euphylliae TaxID=1834034 RepID=A0ABV7HFB5_9GAMM
MRVLIVDDEPLARERLKRMVDELPDYQVVATAENGNDAIGQVESARPEVVLMDIRMPEMDGLQAAAKLVDQKHPPAVIFCTAYDEYAVEAFDVQALGYLMKPVNKEELGQALARATKLNKAQLSALGKPSKDQEEVPARSHISARTHRGLELIPIEDIFYFRADQKYVTVHHHHGEVLIDETLKDLEKELEARFYRIHRNCLVSVNHLEAMERSTQGQHKVKIRGLDESLDVSRRHVSGLRKLMQTL